MLEENTQPEVNEEEVKESESTQSETQQQEEKARELVKVKHLHEEKEIDPYSDEGKAYIQQGMDYQRIKTKYESSKSTLDFVETLARQQGMEVEDYIKAVNEQQERERVNEIADKYSMDPELAEELYLSRKERKEREAREAEYQAKERQQQDYMNFFKEFPDVKVDDIPADVFEIKAQNPNMSLIDAYIRHEYKTLKSKADTQKVNAKNAEGTTGSVAGNEAVTSDYISPDVFNKNKHDQRWVIKNLEKITKSRAKWQT